MVTLPRKGAFVALLVTLVFELCLIGLWTFLTNRPTNPFSVQDALIIFTLGYGVAALLVGASGLLAVGITYGIRQSPEEIGENAGIGVVALAAFGMFLFSLHYQLTPLIAPLPEPRVELLVAVLVALLYLVLILSSANFIEGAAKKRGSVSRPVFMVFLFFLFAPGFVIALYHQSWRGTLAGLTAQVIWFAYLGFEFKKFKRRKARLSAKAKTERRQT